MTLLQKVAASILCAIFALMVLATFLLPAHYARQFRDIPNAGPSSGHPLGTDPLGRDFLAPLLYGTRVSLLLAPAAALLSTLIAAVLGSVAGLLGGWFERIVLAATDLSLALPWLFLLLVVRAMLPLDVPPLVSVVIAFLMMGLWAGRLRFASSALPRAESGTPTSCSWRAPRAADPRASWCAMLRQIFGRSSMRNFSFRSHSSF